jgi:steroid delta-isomerase-like uncharacterized protein
MARTPKKGGAAAVERRSPGQLARERFEALFDRRDFAAARSYWTDQSIDHFLPLGLDVRGPDALEAHFRELFDAIPDWEMTIENIVESGSSRARPGRRPPPGQSDYAVVQWTGSGTFTGSAFHGLEATGKPVSLRGCDVIRFTSGGTVEENTVYYDGAEFARQVGMLPPRDSTVDKGMTKAFNAVTRLRHKIGS